MAIIYKLEHPDGTPCNASRGAFLTRDARRAIVDENPYLQSVVQAQQEQMAGCSRRSPATRTTPHDRTAPQSARPGFANPIRRCP